MFKFIGSNIYEGYINNKKRPLFYIFENDKKLYNLTNNLTRIQNKVLDQDIIDYQLVGKIIDVKGRAQFLYNTSYGLSLEQLRLLLYLDNDIILDINNEDEIYCKCIDDITNQSMFKLSGINVNEHYKDSDYYISIIKNNQPQFGTNKIDYDITDNTNSNTVSISINAVILFPFELNDFQHKMLNKIFEDSYNLYEVFTCDYFMSDVNFKIKLQEYIKYNINKIFNNVLEAQNTYLNHLDLL